MLTVTHENVSSGALSVLMEQLDSFGVTVLFEECPIAGITGTLTCDAGAMRFHHHADKLTVDLVDDRGHFSRSMLIGGMRQMIEEAVELFHRREIN